MHSYVDLYFSPDGASPLEIADRMKAALGTGFIIGPHDIVFDWTTTEEFQERLARLHASLRGTGVMYRVETVSDEPGFVEPVSWPPVLPRGPPAHPGY